LDGYNKINVNNIDLISDDLSTIGVDQQKLKKRNYNILTVISVFYITLGVFIMGLVITQSLVRDLKL
jgi:hypothetical protein